MRVILGAVGCIALALLLAGGVSADQTGEIRGSVLDVGGTALSGVLVTARSPGLQGVRTTVTDAKGFFRLPLLPLGNYALTFELGGFERRNLTENEVRLGYTSNLSVSMKLSALTEEVTVTGEPPLIDRTRGDTSYRLRGNDLAIVPTQARTIAEVVSFTPGVTGVRTDTVTGTDTGLPSFRGEGDAGNNWLVDGLSTKGAATNDPGVRINYDAWDEVQVISDGFAPELGHVVGGTVNVVTKSGGNSFHGELGALLRDRNLRAERQEQLSAASLPETSLGQYYGNLGGPILQDRLWFFLSDNVFSTTDRTVDQKIGWLAIPAGERSETTNDVFGKLTFTPASSHTLSISGTFDTSLDQTGGIGVPETYTKMTYTDGSYRINYTGVLAGRTILTSVFGQNRREHETAPASGDYSAPTYFWQDIGQQTNNIARGSTLVDRRTDLSIGGGTFVDLNRWGHHEFGAGFSYFENGQETTLEFPGFAADPWQGNSFDDGVRITWASPGRPVTLRELRNSFNVDSSRGFGAHVQDTITVGRLALMLGLRSDTQDVFNDAGRKVWSWGMGDFLQPRASLAVDVGGDGRNVFKVGYGLFSMPIGINYLQWVNESFPMSFRQYSWVGPGDPTDAQLRDPANWRFSWEQSGAASPVSVDPAATPNRISRLLLSFERQLGPEWALKVRGVYSRGTNLLEDVAVYDPASPSGLSYVFTNWDEKRRDYRALEVELNGRVGHRLMLNASYAWSRARGSVPGNTYEYPDWGTFGGGGYDGGPFGDRPNMPPGSPNKELYDRIFAGLGGPGAGDEGWYGSLPYDVEHDVKILATWLAPHGFRISSSLEWLSGYSWEKKGWSEAYGSFLTFPEGRGTRTTPSLAYVDLGVDKEFTLTGGLGLAVGVNVYNLFNSQVPVSYVKEGTDLFGQVWARQLPRWVQLKAGLKF